MNNSDFLTQWGYPSEIKTELGASYYEMRHLPDTFRSGRPKMECLLVSKKTGKPYRVCARNEPAPPRTILTRQQTGSDADALDVLNAVYA